MNDIKKMLFPKPHGEYVKEVKKLLSKDAFSPAPKKLFYLLGYLVILFVTYYLFRRVDNIFYYFLLACLATHCLSCIAFLAHELSHHSIVRNKRLRYLMEVLAWGINLIPATLWERVHNHTHHTQTNTPHDPDRLFFKSEKSIATTIYTKVFYANVKSFKWNPMVLFHFIPYITRNIISVFYAEHAKPAIVPYKPAYTSRQKKRIFIELAIIVVLQFVIFYMVGQDWLAYVFASPISYLFTSAIFNSYIFTNHFLNEISEESDPILGTTSVKVPAILNKLHFNFAYHTEHHLFPSMNSDYYPQLSKILREKYPERYNYLQLKEAWKKLWKSPDFISGSTLEPNK